jgi:hypothetical protein
MITMTVFARQCSHGSLPDFFMNIAHAPSSLIPLPALCTGFAFTSAGRGRGEGGMNFGQDCL